MILLVKISSFWGSVLQRCFTVPSKVISNDRDRGNSPVVVIWFSIVIFSRFSNSLNCDWKKALQRGIVECMGIFLCSWNFFLCVEINGEWALSQGYTEARGGQEHILKDVVDNTLTNWYINKQEKIRNSVQGSYCLRNTKSSGKGFKVSTYPY